LFFGDSMITPAISVLSAIEGIKVVTPDLEAWIVPITAVIIVCLFTVQRHGTAKVGRLFGPVMIAWFASIGAFGVAGIVDHPEILRALSPTYALSFVFGHFHIAFFALAAVVLAVTGAEALYADMGHFGRRPITLAWLFIVLPACVLNYFGQGALILGDEKSVSAPFFLLVPQWARLPMVLLATAATIIASQAVITGAFSVAAQAAKLGLLPRLRIVHTSASAYGQVYVPAINWMLMVSVLILVFAFESSAKLAYAYGMAVIGTITIVTLLFFYLARTRWGTPLWIVVIGGGALLLVDLLFLAANLTKLVHGAWLPLLIAVAAWTIMMTWERGRKLVSKAREQAEGPLPEFIDELSNHEPPLSRVPGTAVFLNRGKETAPLAMRANVEHSHVRHEHVVIMTIETEPVPRIAEGERTEVDALGYAQDGIVHVTARFGYMEPSDVPAALRLLDSEETEGTIDVDQASFFLSKLELDAGPEPTMAQWRKRLFIATSYLAADAADFFHLPRDRTVVMGSRIRF
jgi:KUP system potassium uptake protein